MGNYDLHLALHSNATGTGDGSRRGSEVYYYPTSNAGKRFADILVQNFKQIYPLPNNVSAISTTSLGEVARVKAPGVLVEIGYHDNTEDAVWFHNNMRKIAEQTAKGFCEYFGMEFKNPYDTKETENEGKEEKDTVAQKEKGILDFLKALLNVLTRFFKNN